MELTLEQKREIANHLKYLVHYGRCMIMSLSIELGEINKIPSYLEMVDKMEIFLANVKNILDEVNEE